MANLHISPPYKLLTSLTNLLKKHPRSLEADGDDSDDGDYYYDDDGGGDGDDGRHGDGAAVPVSVSLLWCSVHL